MGSRLLSSFPIDLPKGGNKISLYYKKQSQSYQRASVSAAEHQRFTCLRIVSHLFQHSFLTCSAFLPHVLHIYLSPVPHSFLTCCASFTHAYKVSFIMMRHKFHHEETLVSSWWDTRFTMVKLKKDTEHKDARRMRKEWGTHEKGMRNGWERMREPMRQRAQRGFKRSWLYTELTITGVREYLTSNVNLMLYPLCRFKNYPYFCRI